MTRAFIVEIEDHHEGEDVMSSEDIAEAVHTWRYSCDVLRVEEIES